jgi:hypothetical protein
VPDGQISDPAGSNTSRLAHPSRGIETTPSPPMQQTCSNTAWARQLGEQVSTYMKMLSDAGMIVEKVTEPTSDTLESKSVPFFLTLSCRKPHSSA